jgi:fibronectin-binding autotransporter adhesin
VTTINLQGTGNGEIVGGLPSTGGFAVAKNGNGTWTLGGPAGHSGTTTITAGTLRLGNGGTAGSLNATSGITNNANLTINRSNTFSQGIDLNNKAIAGTGSFTQAGSGTTTLTLANTYTGNTTVSAGKLVVNGSISNSPLTSVAAGATLGGSGTVGAATIGGILAPGNSIGTLTATGDVTWNFNNAWLFELGSASLDLASASGGSDNDLLNITGGTSDFLKGIGSSFTFDFAGTGAVGWYKLVDWAGATTFADSDFIASNLAGSLTGSFTVDSGTSALYLHVIPEPRAALLGGLGLLLLLRRKR